VRALRRTVAFALALPLAGCATAPTVIGPLMELAHDEGRPVERPPTPGAQLEVLVRFDPKLPSYSLARLRFLLGQPGHLVFTFYTIRSDGMPGEAVATIDRSYGPEMIADNEPGEQRWVVEPLVDVKLTRGPFLVGIAAPERGTDPRLWATRNDSGAVYERELDGSLGRVRTTPVLRIELTAGPLAH
jgi:hypothetical protein